MRKSPFRIRSMQQLYLGFSFIFSARDTFMAYAAQVLSMLVALQHFYIAYIEIFAWEKPRTMKTFGTDATFAASSAILAKNQGLYNAFIGFGLIWGLLYSNSIASAHIQIFFLSCVVVAGIFGGLTSKNMRIMWFQSSPALVAWLFLYAHMQVN